MQLIYKEDHLGAAAEQIIIYDCQVNFKNPNEHQKTIEKTYPLAKNSYAEIVNMIDNEEFEVGGMPEVGDVLWTHIPENNRYIAHCMMYDQKGNMNSNRLEKMFESVQRKIDEIGQPVFALPPLSASTKPYSWLKVYPVIEEVFSAQGFVYIPKNEAIMKLFSIMPYHSRLKAPDDMSTVEFMEQHNASMV